MRERGGKSPDTRPAIVFYAVYEEIYPSLRHLFPKLTEALEP